IQVGATREIEDIYEPGAILRRLVALHFLDEELQPDVATRNARVEVDDWGADFLVGVDSSGSALAMGPVLAELDRICVFTHAGTHRLTEELVAGQGMKQIFRASAPVSLESILAAHRFAQWHDSAPRAKVGADYEYGHANWALFKQTLQQLRPDVEFVAEAWAPFHTIDFSGHVSSVLAAEPHAIYATPWGGEAVSLLRAALVMGAFEQLE